MTLLGISTVSQTAQAGVRLPESISIIVTMVVTVAKEVFHLVQSVYFLVLGTFEVVYGLIKKNPVDISLTSVKSIFQNAVKRLVRFPKRILSCATLHGSLFLGTGVCELLQGLNVLEVIALGPALPFIALVGNGCFLVANLIMLVHNIKICLQASNLPPEASDEEREASKKAMISSIFAIISAINYIAGISLLIFGGPTAIIIVLVAMGLTSGGLKILFDFFQPYDNQLLSDLT